MILSQICESMIRMSRNGRYGAWVMVAAMLAVAGCCGGGSTHKCDFSPPPTDAGSSSDGSQNCGNMNCDPNQVCCVTKTPPFVSCVAPSDFVSLGCMSPPPPNPPCLSPHDCDAGAVCCLYVHLQSLSCQLPAACAGDGTDSYRTCQGDIDCPRVAQGVCQTVTAGAGISISVCQP